jgi:hypothetical protein
MNRFVLIGLLTVALSTPCIGATDAKTLSLKAAHLGMPKADLLKTYPGLYCSVPDQAPKIELCRYQPSITDGPRIAELETIGSERALSWLFFFDGGRLGQVLVTFPHEAYKGVISASYAKFGNVWTRKKEVLDEANGLWGESATWFSSDSKQMLEVREYHLSKSAGALRLRDTRFIEAERRRASEAAKGRAKDF